jgi:hypothetical protein
MISMLGGRGGEASGSDADLVPMEVICYAMDLSGLSSPR